jgi:hypothetical protein
LRDRSFPKTLMLIFVIFEFFVVNYAKRSIHHGERKGNGDRLASAIITQVPLEFFVFFVIQYKWCTHHEERKNHKGMRPCLIVFLSNLQVLRILCG